MDFTGSIFQMLIMFAIVAMGFVGTKCKVLHAGMVADLTSLLINITLPCMVLASLASMGEGAQTRIAQSFALAAVQFFLLVACALVCIVATRTPRDQRVMYVFMAFCTNTGFIGLPVGQAIFGDASVLVSSVFIMVGSFFVYGPGFALLSSTGAHATAAAKDTAGAGCTDGAVRLTCEGAVRDGAPADDAHGAARVTSRINWSAMLNPAMIACIVTIALYFMDFRFPAPVQDLLSMVGGITAPLAMLMLGIIVAGVSLRGLLTEWRLYPFIVVRQLVAPAVFYVVLAAFGVDEVVAGVFTIMFAMPVGSMAAGFAQMLGHDPVLPAKGTVLTTLASFLIIPALVAFMAFVPIG